MPIPGLPSLSPASQEAKKRVIRSLRLFPIRPPAATPISLEMERVTLIINPVSGRGPVKQRREELEKVAHSLGWRGDVVETTPTIGADLLALDALRKKHTHIVVCGGDGSIMQAVNALVGKRAILGFVPAGTGNLFAHNLGIPTDQRQAMQVALHGQPTLIDVGRANGRYFSIVAGMGWDAAMVRDTHRRFKQRFGLLAYLWSALKNIGHPPEEYRVTIDYRRSYDFRAKSILIANMGVVAKGLKAIEHARPDDGHLNLVVVQAESLFNWLGLCWSALRRRLYNDPRLVVISGKRFTIRATTSRQPFEMDGNDYAPIKQLQAQVLPRRLRVMLPPEKPA